MGNHSVDSLQCFKYLTENVPSWVTRVTDLASHTAAKHAEFSAEYSRLGLSETTKPRRRKNSSMHSLKPDDRDEPKAAAAAAADSNKTGENTDGSYLDPLTRMRASKDYPKEAGAHRKRRAEDDAPKSSVNVQAPDQGNRQQKQQQQQSPLQRPQVVVHYDSHTQNVLEQLVKDIGGARNNIRKGRMNQIMKSGFGLKMFGEDRHRSRNAKSRLDSKGANRESSPGSKQQPPFELADKHLEQAQSLCETAAHQFLRNGDCSSELQKTKERFTNVISLAEVEVERLAAEKEAQRQQLEAEQEEKQLASKDDSPKQPDAEPVLEPEPEPVPSKDTDKGGPMGTLTAIEVDDASSTSSISIDITAFRSTRFRT